MVNLAVYKNQGISAQTLCELNAHARFAKQTWLMGTALAKILKI
jgi:hypothetical protein